MIFKFHFLIQIYTGINPESLQGTRTGVYVGVSFKDVDDAFSCDRPDQAVVLNYSSFPYANMTSWSFELGGPSQSVDAACSSSLVAFGNAMSDIRSGACDRAIVAAVNPIVDTSKSVWLNTFQTLSPDGAVKHMDAAANGFARAEAVVAVLIEPLATAKRNYGELVHVVNGHNGVKDGGILSPSAHAQKDLLIKAYNDVNIDPKNVVFFECHGTGTSAGDKAEATAISEVMLENRKKTLLIGSVKTNIGHTEAAAGHSALVKMLLAGQHGVIPGNLHFNTPNPDIKCLNDPRMKVADCVSAFSGGLIGLSSYGIGGSTAHAIVRIPESPLVEKNYELNLDIPRMIPICGRNEEAVSYIVEYVKQHLDSLTDDLVGLLTNYSKSTPGKGLNSRATVTIKLDATTKLMSAATANDVVRSRPVWLLLSGMGCQWPAMARGLMELPYFAASLRKCADILKSVGIDLLDTMLNETRSRMNIIFDPVGIAAIQVALIDLLNMLDIRVDGIIGFSIGEITAAYADGCLDLKQTLLSSYYRGKCVKEATLPPGLMAAVGLTWAEALEQCPANVIPACHIGEKSVTVSGPKADVSNFVDQLVSRKIFAQKVETNEIAFHNPYLGAAGIEMLAKLRTVIPNPKPRSAKWLSTSIRESQEGAPFTEVASADYLVNNLLSPVLFYNTLKKVPNDAIVIDIGPHGMFKNAISKTLGSDSVYVSFMKRNSSAQDNIDSIFNGLSNLHLSGVNLEFKNLYPEVKYPVAKGTPSLSPLIKWDHSEQWPINCYPNQFNPDSASDYAVEIDLSNLAHSYLMGHMIDGKCIYPATGYVRLVWEAMARSQGKSAEDVSVILDDIVLERATVIAGDRVTRLVVRLNSVSGHATVIEGRELVMSCKISLNETGTKCIVPEVETTTGNRLESLDVYKEMRCRGYDYGGIFKSIEQLDLVNNQALVQWNDNWVVLMDNLLQVSLVLNSEYSADRKLHLPSRIRKVVISPKHFNPIPKTLVKVQYKQAANIIFSEFLQIHGLSVASTDRLNSPTAVFEALRFEAYTETIAASSFGSYINDCNTEIERILGGSELIRSGTEGGLLGILSTLKFEGGDFRSAADLLLVTFAENEDQIQKDLDGRFINDDCLMRQILEVVIENAPKNCQIFDGSKNLLSQMIIDHVRPALANSKIVQETEGSYGFAVVVDQAVADENFVAQLQQSSSKMMANGFILVVTTVNTSLVDKYRHFTQSSGSDKTLLVRQTATESGLSLICSKIDRSAKRVLLFRKLAEITDNPRIIHVRSSNWDWIENAKDELAKSRGPVWFVSTNDPESGVVGFVNCLRREPGGERARCLFAPGHEYFDKASFKTIFQDDLVTNCIVKGNGRFTRKTVPGVVPAKTSKPSSVAVRNLGDLSSLCWQDSPERSNGKDTVDINYVALNFRDILTAMGRIQFADKKLKTLLMEYSGIRSNGERVMGMNGGVLSTTTNVGENHLLWKIPAHWSLEEAATIPASYLTVIYGMIYRGSLEKNESILIHASTGGVGQAAIVIAQRFNCKIYATVSSQEKRDFLIRNYNLKDEHIFNSRDVSFEVELMEATHGRGVDMVLNSLAGDLLQASLRCLTYGGRFIEIGKADVLNNATIGMAMFEKGASVISVMVDQLAYQMTPTSKVFLTELVQKYIDNGFVKPLPSKLFPSDKIVDAFRYMASGNHIGKILLETASFCINPIAYPSIAFYPNKVYLLVGGLGGFGLELMFWMSQRGAKKFVVTSRRGISTSFQTFSLNRLENQGVKITVCKLDVAKPYEAKQLFKVADQNGPIGGIFNLALVLKDGLFENQTVENFELVCAAKVQGTKNLDKLSRGINELDYFVCFSSVVAGYGNMGQTNYGFANSFMDRVCEIRRKEQLHGLSIQWGAIGDVGVLSDTDLNVKGFGLQRINTCLQKLEECLTSSEALVTSYLPDETANDSPKTLVVASPVEKIAHLLGARNANSILETTYLEALGMNSLTALEVKQVLTDNGQPSWSLPQIRKFTMAKLRTLFN